MVATGHSKSPCGCLCDAVSADAPSGRPRGWQISTGISSVGYFDASIEILQALPLRLVAAAKDTPNTHSGSTDNQEVRVETRPSARKAMRAVSSDLRAGQRSSPMEVNSAESASARLVKPSVITATITPAIRPYSRAVTPRRSALNASQAKTSHGSSLFVSVAVFNSSNCQGVSALLKLNSLLNVSHQQRMT